MIEIGKPPPAFTKMVGVIRSTVLVGPNGPVAHRWKRARAKGHAAQVRSQLRELRA
jgi:peroxiredoxin Q/BCP